MVILVCLLAVSCSGTENNPVQEELISYINEGILPLVEEEVRLTQIYNSVTGENAIDDITLYNKLSEEIIPGYEIITTKAELMLINSEEIRKVHELYVEVLNTQCAAFTTMLDALKYQDYDTMTEANKKLTEAELMFTEYQYQSMDLGAKYDVDFQIVQP